MTTIRRTAKLFRLTPPEALVIDLDMIASRLADFGTTPAIIAGCIAHSGATSVELIIDTEARPKFPGPERERFAVFAVAAATCVLSGPRRDA